MANPHLARLLKGVKSWNAWRADNRRIKRPKLDGAVLSECNLAGADLSGCDLHNANLVRANLTGANLKDADLSGASLSGANCYHVRWDGCRLAGTNLGGSNLHSAALSGLDLTGAQGWGMILIEADLRGARLDGVQFSDADLKRAKMDGVMLEGGYITSSNLAGASLVGANLRRAVLSHSEMYGVNLERADLTGASMIETRLSEAILRGAILDDVNLTMAQLVRADLREARLTRCRVFGVAAWSVALEGTVQNDLQITGEDEPQITVDDLEVAQFVYLLLNNTRIRSVIDTVTAKAVLILGRFSAERKPVLDAVREALRARGFLPIVFDFEGPASRNLTETISTLAHLARFIIADVTDPKSIPQELQRIVPDLPSVPVQPLLASSFDAYAMFRDFFMYPSVLPPHRYDSIADLIGALDAKVIAPALERARSQDERRRALEEMLKPKGGS